MRRDDKGSAEEMICRSVVLSGGALAILCLGGCHAPRYSIYLHNASSSPARAHGTPQKYPDPPWTVGPGETKHVFLGQSRSGKPEGVERGSRELARLVPTDESLPEDKRSYVVHYKGPTLAPVKRRPPGDAKSPW